MYDSETVFTDESVGRVSAASRRAVEGREDSLPGGRHAIALRTLDIVVAIAALIFFAPLFVAISIAVYVADPGPIFFAQRRIGRNGRAFACIKFRSMVVNAEQRLMDVLSSDPRAQFEWENDHKLRNDPRITALGLFLRRSSLDELPQFVNVLRGEMSIVGPRPIVEAEMNRYGHKFKDYCRVRPGITGLWQISGRNDMTYRRRVACDVVYSRSKSVLLDLWIMAMTLPAVLLAKGSY